MNSDRPRRVEIVPCEIVDGMWQQQILATSAYRSDCDVLFGAFLDQPPYFGLNGPDDAQALKDACAATAQLYASAVGTPPEGTWITSDAARCKRPTCRWSVVAALAELGQQTWTRTTLSS